VPMMGPPMLEKTSTRVKTGATRSRGPQSLRIRRALMSHLCHIIADRRLNQAQAGRWLRIGQPRISQLLSCQANRFSTDTLLDMLATAGVRVTLVFRDMERRPAAGSRSDEMPDSA